MLLATNHLGLKNSKEYMVEFCNSQMPLNQYWEPFWNYQKPKMKLNKFEEIMVNHYKYYLGDSLSSVTVTNTSEELHPHSMVLGAIEEMFKEMYNKNIKDCI
jgi:hypothetical protein